VGQDGTLGSVTRFTLETKERFGIKGEAVALFQVPLLKDLFFQYGIIFFRGFQKFAVLRTGIAAVTELIGINGLFLQGFGIQSPAGKQQAASHTGS
jgi:hypothetical protein